MALSWMTVNKGYPKLTVRIQEEMLMRNDIPDESYNIVKIASIFQNIAC